MSEWYKIGSIKKLSIDHERKSIDILYNSDNNGNYYVEVPIVLMKEILKQNKMDTTKLPMQNEEGLQKALGNEAKNKGQMKTIKEILKSKGITEATRYHNYEYLYKATVECCDEYVGQFGKPDVGGSCYCGDCGKELTMMTDGKYQCNNGSCKRNLR